MQIIKKVNHWLSLHQKKTLLKFWSLTLNSMCANYRSIRSDHFAHPIIHLKCLSISVWYHVKLFPLPHYMDVPYKRCPLWTGTVLCLYSIVPVKVPMEMRNGRLDTALPFSSNWLKASYASINNFFYHITDGSYFQVVTACISSIMLKDFYWVLISLLMSILYFLYHLLERVLIDLLLFA